MSVSVVETVDGTTGTLGTAPTVTIATTPAAGDVVVVVCQHTGTTGTTTISGLGATWSKVSDQQNTGTGNTVFVGQGATASGAATLSLGTSRTGIVRAYVVRGLTNPTSVAAVIVNATISNTSLTGPVIAAGSGQLVLAVGGSSNTGATIFASTVPSAGWTAQTPVTYGSSAGQFNSTYHVPSTPNQAHTATLSVTGTGHTVAITMLLLGDATDTIHRVGKPSQANGTTTVTPTLPQSPTAGNLLVMDVTGTVTSLTPSVGTPTGWTAGATKSAVNGTFNIIKATFWKVAAGGDSAPAVTLTNISESTCVIEEWAGLDATTPHDADSAGTSATTQSGTLTDSITSTAAGLIWTAIGAKSVITSTYGGGLVEDLASYLTGSTGGGVATDQSGSGVTLSPSDAYSLSSSTTPVAVMVSMAFKQVGSGTPAGVAPPAGAATAAATAPAVAAGAVSAIPAGAATADPTAPAIAGGAVVPVPAAASTADATAPTIAASVDVTVPAASAVAAATQPTISAGGSIDVAIPAAAAAGDATAPVISAGAAITVPAADATADATPPAASGAVDVAPPAATAAADATAPAVSTAGTPIVAPAAAPFRWGFTMLAPSKALIPVEAGLDFIEWGFVMLQPGDALIGDPA